MPTMLITINVARTVSYGNFSGHDSTGGILCNMLFKLCPGTAFSEGLAETIEVRSRLESNLVELS